MYLKAETEEIWKVGGIIFYIIILLMNGENESSESQALLPSPRTTSSLPSFLISEQKWQMHTFIYIMHIYIHKCIYIHIIYKQIYAYTSTVLCSLKACQFKMSSELIFLLAILIPACDSYNPAFCIMCYSTYKLNKQGKITALKYSFPDSEPVCCSMYGSNCCFLSCRGDF